MTTSTIIEKIYCPKIGRYSKVFLNRVLCLQGRGITNTHPKIIILLPNYRFRAPLSNTLKHLKFDL